jgi:ribulose-phosphate 3-epimerase
LIAAWYDHIMRIGPLIAPSLLSANFMRLAEEMRFLETARADAVHVDIMDGRFAPNITVGLPIVEALRRETKLTLDCHLMIVEPSKYAVDFVKAGADWISLHQEADLHLHRTITAIKSAGAKAGVALNPSTPIETLADILPDLDFVLLMSVNPGFGGQSFIEGSLDKVRRLATMRDERGLSFFIQVDGGVNVANAKALVEAGADCLVAGNAVFNAPNPLDAVDEIKAEMQRGRQ